MLYPFNKCKWPLLGRPGLSCAVMLPNGYSWSHSCWTSAARVPSWASPALCYRHPAQDSDWRVGMLQEMSLDECFELYH